MTYIFINDESLSKLATAIGKPVALAPEIQRKQKFQVAKLFVKVDLTKSLLDTIVSVFPMAERPSSKFHTPGYLLSIKTVGSIVLRRKIVELEYIWRIRGILLP